MRFRLGADQLLLAFCPVCDLDRNARCPVATALAREAGDGVLAWVDPIALSVYWCPQPGCERRWHHLGGPLPYPPVADLHPGMAQRGWHPCPWCVREDPDSATTSHRRHAEAVADLHRWDRELQPRAR